MPRKASVIITQGAPELPKTLAQQLKDAQKAVRDHEREAKRAAAEADKLLKAINKKRATTEAGKLLGAINKKRATTEVGKLLKAINKKRDEAESTVKQLELQLEA